VSCGAVAGQPALPYQPYLDGRADVFRWRLGLRPLDLDRWFEFGADADHLLARKRELCARHHDTVFVALDDAEAEAAEVATAIVEHLAAVHPDRDGPGLDPTLHPLDAAARLVPEDLVLMVERDGELVVGAGSVCFPNRWDLRSKLGRTLTQVHAPVPRLNEQLGAAVDGFLDRLGPDRAYWRLGWGLLDTDDLYTPLDGTAASRPSDPGPDDLHVRVERETLRRFPATNCVLFTIRTYLAPLRQVAGDPAAAGRLAAAVATMPDDVRTYKDLAILGDEVVAHLRT
jgi:hypothetical protein